MNPEDLRSIKETDPWKTKQPIPPLDSHVAQTFGTLAGESGEAAGSFKFDLGKPQMNLVPLSSVYAVAEVMTFGAKKYSANGWKTVPDAVNRYTAAMLRHMTAIQDGEEIDEDSGLPHADHVACNALFLSWFRRNQSTQENLT